MDSNNRSSRSREEIAGLLMAEVVLPELQKCNRNKLPNEFKYLTRIAEALNEVIPALKDASGTEAVRNRGEYFWPFAQMGLEEFDQQHESLPSKLRERIRTVREVIAVLCPHFGLKTAVTPFAPSHDGNAAETSTPPVRKGLENPNVLGNALGAAFEKSINETVLKYRKKFDFRKIKSMSDVPEEIKEDLRFLPFSTLSMLYGKDIEDLMDDKELREMAAHALCRVLSVSRNQANSFYAYVTPSFRNMKDSSWEKFRNRSAL